jgi:1L-myo-inositol 1-phosphate cytidylyltransferase
MKRRIRQAVILAAGLGSRIREEGPDLPKPLHTVMGQTMLKRTVQTLAVAGIERIYVVVGYRADELRAHVAMDPDFRRFGVRIEFVQNDEYRLSNGVSVLKVKGIVDGPFVLSMCDHIYDASLAELASRADMSEADLWLCVDRRVSTVYDIDDATKVMAPDGYIQQISKNLTTYDCIDCGVFAVGGALLGALEGLYATKGDCSLSEGVKALVNSRRARVLDIGDAFWQDVDTVAAKGHAELALSRDRALLRRTGT